MQLPVLTLGLDPLGDHGQIELLGQREHRGDDRPVVGSIREPLDEDPIDLDQIDRQHPQQAEARRTAAEVVDRQPHAESFSARSTGSIGCASSSSEVSLSSRQSSDGGSPVAASASRTISTMSSRTSCSGETLTET